MREGSRTVLVLALVAAITLVTGCAPKIYRPLLDAQIFIMRYATSDLSTGEPSPGYDAVPLEWNPLPNTIVDSKMPIVHVNGEYSTYPLHWSALPFRAVQIWDYNNKPLLTATSDKTQILVPPEGAQHSSSAYLSPGAARWYAPIENAFVSVPHELGALPSQKTLDGLTIPITEFPLAPGSQAQTLTVAVPSGLTRLTIVYGSGSVNNGFVWAVGSRVGNTSSLLLLRMNDREATWVQCTDATGHGTDLVEWQSASFACIGGFLYFTHARGKIYCIDMWSPAPSVTTPEKINTLLERLHREGPTTTQAPFQALLSWGGGVLIIGYPDANWNMGYYATLSSGEVIGHLYADATSITSFDSQGHRGTSVLVDNARGVLSFPSWDLFESYTTLTGTSMGAADEQVFFAAARSFAEQALAAGNHHLTAEPVITVSSKQVQSGKVEALMTIETMDALNSGPVDAQPVIAGELQYLHDHGAELSAAARKAVEDDISEWHNTIESAMNTPTETNYLIKIVVDVDQAGTIDASTLQVYVDDGAVGIHLTPAAEFLKSMRSAWTTIAQAYANAESIAAAAKAH